MSPDSGRCTARRDSELWAVVKKDGTLVRGHGLAPGNPPTRKEATGIYRVTFNRDVAGCSYQATIGNPDTTPPVQDSQVTVSAFPGKKDAVLVRTANRLNQEADSAFQLAVICPK